MRRFGSLAGLAFAMLAASGLAISGLALAKGPGMAGGVLFKFGPDLAASDWRYLSFPRRRGVAFTAHGEDTVIVQTKAGVGVLWHPVPRQLSRASKARWRWRVTKGVGPTDLTKKGGDDRTLAVYFAFTDEAVTGTVDLMDLLRSERGHLMVYVWGGAARPGTVLPLPYFDGRGRTVVKRAADTQEGVWFNELADVRGDFRRAFGRPPGRLVAIAVSSDADDTGGLNDAAVADLCVK
jgi:hypothetical protein